MVSLKVDSAVEVGFQSRDDQFHLQEVRRRRSVLLTRDVDFLDDRRFPYHALHGTAVVVLSTAPQNRVSEILRSSFRRKPESRLFKASWTPAFAGVTVHLLGTLFCGRVLRTELATRATLDFGYALVALLDHIAASDRKDLAGLKVELRGPRMIFRARVGLTS